MPRRLSCWRTLPNMYSTGDRRGIEATSLRDAEFFCEQLCVWATSKPHTAIHRGLELLCTQHLTVLCGCATPRMRHSRPCASQAGLGPQRPNRLKRPFQSCQCTIARQLEHRPCGLVSNRVRQKFSIFGGDINFEGI